MIIIFSDDQDEVKVPKEAVSLLKQGLQAVAKPQKPKSACLWLMMK